MTDFRKVIEETTVRILEDWALMMVEEGEITREQFSHEDPFLVSTISFKGPFEGTYSILCQTNFAECLATNLLGCDDGASQDDLEDALRELANVLCGNLLTECFGEDAVFDLILPHVKSPDEAGVAAYFNERTVMLLADDAPIAVTFEIDNENAN